MMDDIEYQQLEAKFLRSFANVPLTFKKGDNRRHMGGIHSIGPP